jgi:F-type H+-transporting ATPase subunit epsilon
MEHSASNPSPGAGLRVLVVTPEQTVLDATTEFVALPLYDGELGIAPGHAPLIGRLGFGPLRIGHEAGGQVLYVDGGFVQVTANVVSVLTNRAIPRSRLDQAAIESSIESALSVPAAGEAQIARREQALAQSRAQLRVARSVR